MIKSFKNDTAEYLFKNGKYRKFPAELHNIAQRKLFLLHVATCLDDLRAPPSNRLEALKGNRKGQYSIRINNKYRICFVWNAGHAELVEIIDYH